MGGWNAPRDVPEIAFSTPANVGSGVGLFRKALEGTLNTPDVWNKSMGLVSVVALGGARGMHARSSQNQLRTVGIVRKKPTTVGRGVVGVKRECRRLDFTGLNSTLLERRVAVRSHDGDSDDYEVEQSYDSDDYEDMYLLESMAEAPRNGVVDEDGQASPSSGQHSGTGDATGFFAIDADRPQGKRIKAPISKGFNLFLLFGAAVDRFVSRIQYGILASLRFALSCLNESLKPLRSRVSRLVARFRLSPAGKKLKHIKHQTEEIKKDLPDDTWGKLLWLWDRPPVQRLRLTISMANLSFRLPALVALIVTQGSLLASQVSLPMLAPLLLGTGMMMRSIKSNASFLFPRIGLLVVLLWILWFTNSVIQNTVQYLKKQKAIDDRLAGGIITITEVSTLLVAMVVLLSMIGVNVSALLLPAGIAVAVAAKDLSHNFLAGFFLFVVQPFKLGDRVAVSSSAPSQGPGAMGAPPGWFEGICEKVDLRYTVVRQGRRKLMIPNSAFLTREFMVLDDMTSSDPKSNNGSNEQMEFLTNDNRHVWQYMNGPPFHQELAQQQPMSPQPQPQPQPQQPPPPQQQQPQPRANQGDPSARELFYGRDQPHYVNSNQIPYDTSYYPQSAPQTPVHPHNAPIEGQNKGAMGSGGAVQNFQAYQAPEMYRRPYSNPQTSPPYGYWNPQDRKPTN
ncbi:hypothetical protein PSENEW3_00006167 [Picochlorum sp. SENEW3]|nr:hypothetical protein PSENEW3_00006167 [Picochlorum sp. SENEW3]